MPATRKTPKKKPPKPAAKRDPEPETTKVPGYALNFEHTLRQFAIEKEEARHPKR